MVDGEQRRWVRRVLLMAAWVVGVVALAACAPQVGDECRTFRDCAGGTDIRTCDTSVPGGYCTIFDCERNGCPKESVCVDFGVMTACMLRCDDRRCPRADEGFVCREDVGPVPFCYID